MSLPRTALLAGVDHYPHYRGADLNYAVSDCHRLKRTLQSPRFDFDEVAVLENGTVTRDKLLADLDSDFDALYELFVLYFAGHGDAAPNEQNEPASYLIPSTGRPNRPTSWVRVKELVEAMRMVKARRRVLILDACRGGAVRGLPKSFEADLAAEKDVLVLSACSVDEFAHEGKSLDAGHYTYFLCKALEEMQATDGVLDASMVHVYASIKLERAPDCHQTPTLFAHCHATINLLNPEREERTETEAVTTSRGRDVLESSARTDSTDDKRPPHLRADVELPQSMAGKYHRTSRIVDALRQTLNEPAEDDEKDIVRIYAGLSSFAIPDDDPVEHVEYLKLLIAERDYLTELLNRGTRFHVLLGWFGEAVKNWPPESVVMACGRLEQLHRFCDEVSKDAQRAGRLTMINCGAAERNILLLRDQFFFEGRRLGVGEGFDVTTICTSHTNPDRIQDEIQLFDTFFNEWLTFICGNERIEKSAPTTNQFLLAHLASELEVQKKKVCEFSRTGVWPTGA